MITPASLRAARRNSNRLVVQLLNYTSRYPDEVVWVYEGKDSHYYGTRISTITGRDRIATIVAGGKTNVLNLFRYANGQADVDKDRIAFFVDRDFDANHPASPCLYVTPCYSIENLYLSDRAFQAVLQNDFDLMGYENRRELEFLVNKFRLWKNVAFKRLSFLNAWLLQQRRVCSSRLNLSDVRLSDMVAFSFVGKRLVCQKNYSLRRLNVLFPKSGRLARADVFAAEHTLAQLGCETSFRGKYLMEFLHFVLAKLKEDALKPVPIFFKRRRKPTLPLTKKNLLSELAAHASTPNCLHEFLLKYRPVEALAPAAVVGAIGRA